MQGYLYIKLPPSSPTPDHNGKVMLIKIPVLGHLLMYKQIVGLDTLELSVDVNSSHIFQHLINH